MSVKSFAAARIYVALAVIIGWGAIALGAILLFSMLSDGREPALVAIVRGGGFAFLGFLSLVVAQFLDAHLDTASNTALLVEQNARLLKHFESARPANNGCGRQVVATRPGGQSAPGQPRYEPKVLFKTYKGVEIYKVDGKFEARGKVFDSLTDAELSIFRGSE